MFKLPDKYSQRAKMIRNADKEQRNAAFRPAIDLSADGSLEIRKTLVFHADSFGQLWCKSDAEDADKHGNARAEHWGGGCRTSER